MSDTTIAAAPADAATSSSDGDVLYRLSGVERRYLKSAAEVLALRGVSLDVAAGEFIAVQGPSGSGKSTLLQLLGALERPTAGTVVFQGEDLSQLGDRALTEIRARRIGFVFQQFNLIPTLAAVDNVAIAIDPSRGRSGRIARATELLERVGLGARLRHLPPRLSGGEQQRVAIARALANHPDVIIADEPTGNLDSASARDLMALLAEVREESDVTVVVATHDDEVAAHARRRLLMRDGAIVEDSSPHAR